MLMYTVEYRPCILGEYADSKYSNPLTLKSLHRTTHELRNRLEIVVIFVTVTFEGERLQRPILCHRRARSIRISR